MMTNNNTNRPTVSTRGFAALDKAVLAEISRKGGKAAHQAGTAHKFTPSEAAVAGRKGGQAIGAKRRAAKQAAAEAALNVPPVSGIIA